MKIETILSPSLFHQISDIEQKAVVVIDILRATSTIVTILNNGASSVIPVKEEEDALIYQSQGYLVGGERGGETIPGFDFGNSPFQYSSELVNNKDVVLTTTNGTKCLEMSKNAKYVFTGAFLNLNILVDHIKTLNRDVVLFCAGWKDKVNLEDSLFAGAVAHLFPKAEIDDATLLCKHSYELTSSNIFEALKGSNHFLRLAGKGVIRDIEYCCMLNKIEIVPELKNGKLISRKLI